MNKINRPTASNYSELENKRQLLAGKADSVFSYRKVNPYSVVFDKLKRDKNKNFSTDLWQQAANKGELDQYINLLSQNPTKSSKLGELESKYSNFLDYDTTMLALSYDAVKDEAKEERFDSDGNSIGSFTQKELIEKVLEQETLRWDAQILEDAKRSGTFWQKLGARAKSAGAETAGFVLDFASGVVRVTDQTVDTLYAASTVLDEWIVRGMDMSFEQISATYAQAVTSNDRGVDLGIDATKIQESLKEMAFDIRRQYSYHTNAATGEVDWYGKILTGMADSMGYMTLSMLTGNPAMMYVPMFTGNVQENVAMSGPNANYSKILTNAATKAGVEYGIEWGLGKLLGFTKLDNLIGIGDDAAKATKDMVVKGVTNTSAQAAKQVTKQLAKDMLQEGTEEVLQELSGIFLDYLYGDQYATRSKESFTLENFTQSFVIGAATSFAIGSFSNLTTTRATGIDGDGLTYKMGMFQSVTYKQSIATLNSWQKTAMDPNAKAQDRLDAAMKLQGVVATLGSVYESAGIKNTIQAEKLLSEIQNYQDRKTAIKDKVQRGVYITDMLTNLDNEVGGTNWTTAFADVANGTNNLMYDMQEAGTQRKEQNKIDKKQQAVYHSISTALHNTAIARILADAGVDVFKKVVDVTGEVDKGTVFEVAKNAGYNVVVPTNGREVIISDDVLFLPEGMNDVDIQTLLKDIVTQNTVLRIIENMPAALLVNVTETFSQAIGTAATKYSKADLNRKAIAALMFDKSFQLKMLLKTKENSNTWGTDTVIDFISNLQKQVVKTYTKSETETTASGRPKRVLSDITKRVSERMIESLQDSLVVYNTTVKRSTETDAKGKTVLKKKLKDVITSASEQKILADQNVQFSIWLDKLKNDKQDITPEDKAFIHRMVTQLHSDPSNTDVLIDIMIAEQIRDAEDGKIDGSTINGNKPSIPALEARILKIFTTGTLNARLDLHSILTFEFARTNIMAKNKLHYLPIDESNISEFPEARDTRTSIEKSMLGGQTIIDVIEGNADYSLLAPSLTDFDDDFDTNEITRFYAINNLFKQKTGSRFAILQNGALIKTSDSTEDLNAELVTAVANGKLREGIDALRATKKNGVLTIQDFYSANVPTNIGKVPVAFSEAQFAHGYHLKNGIIEVAFGSADTDVANFAVILHEMIHAVNSTTFTDLRYKQVGGGSADLTKAMNLVDKGTKDSIGEYIRANFPITALRSMVLYEEHSALAIGDALYRLLYEENTARSVNHLYQFSSLGFDYKLIGNNMYLVSPDGKRNWTVKENMPVEQPTTLGDVKLKATAFESWVLKDNNPELTEIAKATEIAEIENIVAEWRSTAGFSVTHLSKNYDTIVADIKANIITSYPDINLINLDRLLDNFFRFKPLFLNKFDIADSSTYRMKTLLNAVHQYSASIARLSATATYIGVIDKSKRSKLMKDLVGQLNNQIVNPVKNLYMANTILYEVAETDTAEPVTSAFQAPKSFNFGDYSLVKHTGRTYMLTHKPAGQSRYTTQEVDMDTLLPTRSSQKPILTDNTMRERMLFVIAKKTEIAKKKDKEPTLPEPPKKAKPNEVIWQWGQWTVKNYNKDNYIVSKNVKTQAATEDSYEAIQIVNKETLLPDTMFGSTGNPILSASERRNLLDWIEHGNTPFFNKKKMEDGTIKTRYVPNLTDKSIIDVGQILRWNEHEYRVKEHAKDGIVLENLDTKKLSTHLISELSKAFDTGELEDLNKPTLKEPVTASFAAPNLNRAYVSNATAKKSNLKYFIKKGKPIQMHSDVIDFVEGTTTDFDKLSKFFKERILKGKLTRHDVAKYIHTTKSINAYTWKAIAQFIYHNEALADIGPTMAKFFLDKDRLEKYAIMTRLTEDLDTTLKINSITDFKKFENEFNAKLNSDPELIENYKKATDTATAWWSYDETGKLTKRDDLVIDEKQLLPIFMRHYDGSLKSLNDIFTLAKRQAGQQLLTSLYENTSSSGNNANANKVTKISSGNAATENNTVGAKTGSSGIYNWLDNIRKNTVDYETAPELKEDAMTFEELTLEDKYNMLYDYLYAEELSYTNNPTEQEEYIADEDVTSALSKMSEADIDKVTQFILNEARNATPQQVTTTEDTAADAPARKTLKDGLRNKLRVLIRRLAGLKTNYNKLAPEVQALINFSINKSTMNTEAYINLSDAELIALNDKVAAEVETLKVAQKQAQELEKTKASILRKVAALQKKERLLAEREASVKARATAIKEGKTLREKLRVSYETKVAKQTFTITGPSIINPKLQTILDHTWDKTTNSKVKYMDDSVQTIQNVHNATEFYKAHAAELSEMTLADIEDITEWLIGSNIAASDSVAKQTFEATKFFILAYIYNETGAKHIFSGMNSNLKLQLGNHLKAIQTSAGTLLSLVKQVKDKLNPVSVIAVELFDRFEYKISDIDQDRLDKALSTGNVKDITQVLHSIKQEALKNLTPEKVTASRKVAAIRSMSMTSSPMTWVRNIISNIALTHLNPISSKLGNLFFPKLTAKTEATTRQFKLDGKITPEIQTYITEQFVDSGFFDETVDQISKYNPSQILRHKKAGDSDIIGDMLVHAIYNQFYSESMFDSKMFNTIHAFLMRRLSDKKWVREASVKYLGKLLAETGHHLDKAGNLKTGIDDDVMKMVANAFALATTDYMHSDNFFSHVEQWLTQNSPVFWSAYKIIMPFATASWNWFKAAVRYSPIGLGQSIYKLTQLENEITKTETKWKKGESQIAPELATYLVRRDLGSGIIGTIAFGFGAILAALGFISLEDDDWGTPKLRIGNLRIDVSSIFGSSSALAGAAFVNTFKNTKDLGEALDAMMDPLVDGFFFTELLSMDANSPEGWFEWSKYQAQSVMLSFIPSMVRYISGATYTGNYRARTSFQKAVSRLPFLGQAFNVPKRTNVYTGDQDGTMWDIVHRLLPYFEIVTKSQSQSMTEQYGLNKEELNGTYKINDKSFKTDPRETARINKLYGELNADDLVDFYANKSTYRVLGENAKYATKYYSQMTETEIGNALSQLFSKNSTTAKVSAWLAAGHTYYTNDRELFNTLRALGYNNVFIGNKGFVE